jgi:AcrR family transcriptional regulator
MSPAATLDHADALDALRHAADSLFYEQGVAGVTVAAIRDASGVSMRRIYELCPSKDDLVTLWLEYRHELWTTQFTAAVAVARATGRSPVDAVFDAIESWMVDTAFRGCGFINTHAEHAVLTDDHRRIIQHHKQHLADWLDGVTGEGQAIAVLVDGAIIQASMFQSTTPIDQARRAAHALLHEGPNR